MLHFRSEAVQNQTTVIPRHTLTRRAFALAIASVLTLSPLLALHFRNFANQTPTAPERVTYLNLHSSPRSTEKLEPTVATPKPRIATSENRRAVAAETTPAPAVSDSTAPAAIHASPQPQAEIAEVPNPPASAPIRLDAAIIRAANQASKSEVNKMAAASGTYIGDGPASETEKLAGAITRTAKEDCLAANPGGSILSALAIAYQAARSKCK